MARKGLLGSTLGVRGAKNTNDLQRAALESRLKIPIFLVLSNSRLQHDLSDTACRVGELGTRQMVERDAAIAAAEARAASACIGRLLRWSISLATRVGAASWKARARTRISDRSLRLARVRGFQGDDYSRPDKVMACAKHFAAYGAAEGGREYNTVDMSERRLREVYLVPFKAAKDAGVGSFMTSFNDLERRAVDGKFVVTQADAARRMGL